MNISMLKEQAKHDTTKKPGLIKTLSIAVGLLFAVAVVGYVFLQNTIEQFNQVEQQIQEMEAFIAQADKDERNYKRGRQPIAMNELDAVQSGLIQTMKGQNLEIETIQRTASAPVRPEENNKPASRGVEYEIIFKGAWKDTLEWLQIMQSGPVFLNVSSLRIETAKGGEVKTNAKYKIFTE